MYEARQKKEKVSRRIDGYEAYQRVKIIDKRKNIVIQREPFEKLNNDEWTIVLSAINVAKQICNFWLQNPDTFNTAAAQAFNRRDVSQRTYIPQLQKIIIVLDGLSHTNFFKDLSNKENYYAQVDPTDLNHTIILGPAFWNAPDGGNDTKAGTLIHEITHFIDVIGTDDHGYGDVADVQSNHGLSSTLGGNNADTWEHFMEF